MAPLIPSWEQPSHPAIQEVLINSERDFTTKSTSRINIPPYALYAKLTSPPCSRAAEPTYATVQVGKNRHLNLNSDLVYINHSCEPSVIFDTSSFAIIAGPQGLQAGQELTFFYPSTEWNMAQGFDCFCGSKKCRGFIDGAKKMPSEQLKGMWLNAHIRELLEERDKSSKSQSHGNSCFMSEGDRQKDATAEALKASLEQARKMVDAAQKALDVYIEENQTRKDLSGREKGSFRKNGVGSRELSGEMGGDTRARRGVTSRETSGEMGGDTVA